jgi:hypothetical protein
MSAVSMANIAVARRVRKKPAATGERTRLTTEAAAAEGLEPPAPDNAVTAALKVITTYIPTEILTLYVSAIAVLLTPPQGSVSPNYTAGWRTFAVFLVLTPVVNWLVLAAKVRAAGDQLPRHPEEWPIWEMFAAIVAFTAWAAALPQTPFVSIGISPNVAGYLVLVVTTFLGLIASIIHPAKM